MPTLGAAVRAGDIAGVHRFLAEKQNLGALAEFDEDGYQPLMRAVLDLGVPVELVDMLLVAGADPNAQSRTRYGEARSVLSLALSAGDPQRVRPLLDAGADLHYRRGDFGAVLDAVHGRDVVIDPLLLPLLELLVQRGARLNDMSRFAESALRVLSRLGRFDAVSLLLAAGADESQLGWTPLIRAVAIGSEDEVRALIVAGVDLEARDTWQRTALLVALLAGDIGKASLLRAHGADLEARGRCGQTALCYAIDSRQPAMLDWALAAGATLERHDEFGNTPLMHAAEEGRLEAVLRLVQAGADVDAPQARWSAERLLELPEGMAEAMLDRRGSTALNRATDAETARALIDAGADPQHLDYEARRGLLGLHSDISRSLLDCSAADYAVAPTRRFGRSNPEPMSLPFWLAMIRAGVTGYDASERFGAADGPVWCAQRYGQSISFLDDGRIVQVGGEHEDWYDPDFCIYNDVFVHHPDGRIEIFGYPETVFPPTDFHTATVVGERIYLIGSLGYQGQRRYGHTPVYLLDLRDYSIQTVATRGTAPGWIFRHRARLQGECIVLSRGEIMSWDNGNEVQRSQRGEAVLDLSQARWLDAEEVEARQL